VKGNLISLLSGSNPEDGGSEPLRKLLSVSNATERDKLQQANFLCSSTTITSLCKIILAFVFAAYNRTLSVANIASVLQQYYY
jgi:hypothetical protein